MTKKLFWDDAYLKDFDAKIISIDGNQLVLDQTAFNPRGGGLVGDIGTLGDVKVLDTVKGGNDSIVHLVESVAGFSPESSVHGNL